MNRMKFLLLVTVLPATVAVAFILAPSNIDPTDKWSWGENIGFMNWRDADSTNEGVVVDTGNNALSGYLWCENVGWINVGDGNAPYGNNNDTDYGVNIEGDDDLKGFGWSENIGWVNFGWGADADDTGRAQFDSAAGRFRGFAWAENIGWINLDDGDHFVAVATCTEDADCNDGNVCTQDRCIDGSCVHTGKTYGDIDNDGDVDLFDLFCILNCFSGDFSVCSFEKCDLDPCEGDVDVDLFDLFAVLNAFSGDDPCCGG